MILAKTNQITRYKTGSVDNDTKSFEDYAKSQLNFNKIYDIDKSPEEINVGWCDHKNNYTTIFDNIIIDNFLIVSMRIDEKKVSKHLIKKICASEEAKIEHINDGKKKEIKDAVIAKLMSETKAIPKIFDCAWDYKNQIVYFFSTNKKANEIFETLFKKTFGDSISNMIPFIMAEEYYSEEKIVSLNCNQFNNIGE